MRLNTDFLLGFAQGGRLEVGIMGFLFTTGETHLSGMHAIISISFDKDEIRLSILGVNEEEDRADPGIGIWRGNEGFGASVDGSHAHLGLRTRKSVSQLTDQKP
jgi:hypothetical protein